LRGKTALNTKKGASESKKESGSGRAQFVRAEGVRACVISRHNQVHWGEGGRKQSTPNKGLGEAEDETRSDADAATTPAKRKKKSKIWAEKRTGLESVHAHAWRGRRDRSEKTKREGKGKRLFVRRGIVKAGRGELSGGKWKEKGLRVLWREDAKVGGKMAP